MDMSETGVALVGPRVMVQLSAESPYQIAELYAAGKMSRARCVLELALFPYAPPVEYDLVDQLPLTSDENTWDEVQTAKGRHLIDGGIYREALELSEVLVGHGV